MIRCKRTFLMMALMGALAACNPPPDSAFMNRDGPEALLDVSSEVVNLSVGDPTRLSELADWISRDQPTRAELYCMVGTRPCDEARKVLELSAVPLMVVPSYDNSVALVYERILARDCRQSFVDNSHNMYNTSHPAFGCSVSANTVQQVSDRQQFINPNLSDMPDAKGGVAAYQRAYMPKAEAPKAYGVDDALVSKAKSGGGGN